MLYIRFGVTLAFAQTRLGKHTLQFQFLFHKIQKSRKLCSNTEDSVWLYYSDAASAPGVSSIFIPNMATSLANNRQQHFFDSLIVLNLTAQDPVSSRNSKHYYLADSKL